MVQLVKKLSIHPRFLYNRGEILWAVFFQKNELGYDIIDSNTVGQNIIENFVGIRILDSCGNIVLGENVMEPGTSLELDALQDDTEYVVEVKTTADFVRPYGLLSFIFVLTIPVD